MGQTLGPRRMNPLSSSGASRSPHPAFSVVWTPLRAVVPSGVQTTAARAATAPAAELTATRRGVARQTLRFAAIELGIWALLYAVYLAVRGIAIADEGAAFANASLLIDLEKAGGLFHEAWLQKAVGTSETFFSAYYMLGFGPLVIGTLIWLGLRRPGVYHQLRTVLIVSIALASLVYVLVPTAPPRLVEGLGIADTVGLSSHDTGSFAGIRFNPYAAMPSMHVGWSVLVAIYGFRAARRRPVRALFALHPLLMALAVTATGNHFFVDSLAGAGIAGATLLTIHLSRRWVAPAWQHRTPRHASAS
jgi:PAP2 superfamily